MTTKMTTNRAHPRLLVVGAVVVATTVLGTLCHADNPIIQTKYTADPAPLVHNDTVYLYTSHDEDDAQGFKMLNWMLYSTTDMVNWTDHGIVGGVREPYRTFRWADGNNAWAPQCIQRNGMFYLYCPFPYKGQMAIGVAVSSSPTGPFVDPLGKPLVEGSYDPTVFIDDDGQAYMYWGGNGPCYYIKLNEDMISTSGDIQTASIDFSNCPPEASYTEGPWFWKKNGHYYLAYASRCCPEGIGYAMSDSPTGPWTCKGTIMDPSALSDGNHPGIVDYRGKSYVFGFNYELLFSIQGDRKKRERRSICVREMTYNADGSIKKVPWWGKGGPVPSVSQVRFLNPYDTIQAETICWSEGMETEPRDQGGMNVYPTRDGAFIKVKGVDFGDVGAATFTASVASDGAGGAIALHLDSVDGPLVATLGVTYTGGQWKPETAAVTNASGVHDLFLVFKGDAFKADTWQFTKKTAQRKLVALDATVDRAKIDSSPGPAHQAPLKVLAIYSDGTCEDVGDRARMTVKNPAVVSVSGGVVTGIADGRTEIEAVFAGQSDTLPVIVKDLESELIPDKVTVDFAGTTLIVGTTQALTVTAQFRDGHTQDVTTRAVVTVDDPQIVSVKDGLMTGLEKGAATILVTFKGELGDPVAASVDVTVSYRDPFVQNSAAQFNHGEGIQAEDSVEGGQHIGFIESGDWVRFDNLDFGAGAAAAEFRVASTTAGGTIEIRLDSVDGPLIGTCKVDGTGGWQSWVTRACDVSGVTGRHDVVFRFTGGSGFLMNIYRWMFRRTSAIHQPCPTRTAVDHPTAMGKRMA